MEVMAGEIIPFTPNNSASETVMALPLSWNVTERAVSFGASGNPKSGGGIPRDGTTRRSMVTTEREYIVARQRIGLENDGERDLIN